MDVRLKIRKLLMFKLITRRILSEKTYYQYCYFILFGKSFSYTNPVGFNAKIQWLKVFYRNPEIVKLADKYLVRDYVAKTIGKKYLVPVYNVYSSIAEIQWEELPPRFVMKATHGSKMNLLCKNKSELNKVKEMNRFNKWLNTNFYWQDKEWQYKSIKPRLICEHLLGDTDSELLELKLFCYNSKPEFVIVYPSNKKYRNIYNINWERVKGATSFKQGPDIKKPENFETIVELATKLSSGLPFVRVDFLYEKDQIYFGELTFTPSSGMYRFNPSELDLVFGKPLHLPKLN